MSQNIVRVFSIIAITTVSGCDSNMNLPIKKIYGYDNSSNFNLNEVNHKITNTIVEDTKDSITNEQCYDKLIGLYEINNQLNQRIDNLNHKVNELSSIIKEITKYVSIE